MVQSQYVLWNSFGHQDYLHHGHPSEFRAHKEQSVNKIVAKFNK